MTPCGPFQPDPFCDNSYLCKSGQPARVRSDPGTERPEAGGAAQPPPAAVAPHKPRLFLAAPAAGRSGRSGRGGAGAALGRPLERRGGVDRRGAAGVGRRCCCCCRAAAAGGQDGV